MSSRLASPALVSATLLSAALVLASARAQAAEPSLPPFYQSVTAMKPLGKLGEVVAKEPVATAIPGARAWRIAHVSSDLLDRPTIATALVIAPEGEAPAAGRPVVAWAHGTTGTAQNCGPSQEWDPAQPLNQYFLIGGTAGTDFGVPAADEFIRDGYVLVATDYQGLGGGGAHQYSIAATQARDTIDSIRAVGAMGLGAGKRAAIYGWSQGGGAALAAASMPDYIARLGTAFDGVAIVGFAALAPYDVAAVAPQGQMDDATAAKTMTSLIEGFSDNLADYTHYAMTMWAMAATFPELKMADLFTDEGAKALDTIFLDKCVHTASDTIAFNFGANFRALSRRDPANLAGWARNLLRGSVPPVKPVAPVVIYWGTKDIVSPPVMGKLYREQMCRMGANVARVQLAGEQSHFTTPGASKPLYVPWIEDRFAGKPAADGCAPN
jgi:pimeloyl-ACP methyl ester carboxylesterase